MALLQHHLAVGGVHEELDVAVTERHAGDDLVHLDLVADRAGLTGVLLTDGPGLVQPLVGQERMRHGAQPTACVAPVGETAAWPTRTRRGSGTGTAALGGSPPGRGSTRC